MLAALLRNATVGSRLVLLVPLRIVACVNAAYARRVRGAVDRGGNASLPSSIREPIGVLRFRDLVKLDPKVVGPHQDGHVDRELSISDAFGR